MTKTTIHATGSFSQIFRLVFVIFFLHLLGDSLFRWNGFRYYASFSDFIPSLALVSVLWAVVAVFSTLVLWLIIRAIRMFFMWIKRDISPEQIILFITVFGLLTAAVWYGKRNIVRFGLTVFEKSSVLIMLLLVSFILVWLCRARARAWFIAVQERMSPVIWLFGILVMASVPVAAYHIWWGKTDNRSSREISQIVSEDSNRPNIILVTFDALTARDMSLYGYNRATTPFISEWAKNATLFTRLEAESNFTKPTTASLMTGKRLWTHQLYHNMEASPGPDKGDTENFPLMLRNNGYQSIAMVVNPMASTATLGIKGGFNVAPQPSDFHNPSTLMGMIDGSFIRLFSENFREYNWIIKGDFIFRWVLEFISSDPVTTEFPPHIAFNRFLDYLQHNRSQPYFAWIHLLPPHDPYLPPEPYRGKFNSPLISDKKTLRDWSVRRILYDEFIRYCDSEFENFISHMAAEDNLENTIIIVSADHGESFEHGYHGHGGPHLYEQVTHIPLIIKQPLQAEGRTIDVVVEQIDLPATILEFAGIPQPLWMEGRSLVPLIRGKKLPRRPAFAMALSSNPSRGSKIVSGTIAVWEGDYKLIHYLQKDKSLLFNLKEDPDELSNIFNEEPEIGKRLLAVIRDNLQMANEKIINGG
jgi:arylsulfatase A-like enzyme